ncbi:MAG: hypothetical protein ACRDDK_06510 [Cetobacterium sp.]|uniref:hypothetical protein n=1 Tax=Cetobacterium sp. TaxID=2071632 RepID=UPI003EE766B8
MNKKIFIFLMGTIIFTNLESKDLESKDLESLFDNYSEAVSQRIDDKVKSINDTIVNKIDSFGKNFIIPYEENSDEKNKFQEEDSDYRKNNYRKNDDEDDDDENDED